jgi:hypothetical protein
VGKIIWKTQDEFDVDGLGFFFNGTDYRTDQADSSRFHILKNKQFFDIYDCIFENCIFNNMLEIGFCDGGSSLFF